MLGFHDVKFTDKKLAKLTILQFYCMCFNNFEKN